MRQPNCVLWALTRKHSAFKRQAPGTKARCEAWSADPMCLTGFHNASSQGFTSDCSIGLACDNADTVSKNGNKSFRRQYVLRVAHKSCNKKAQKKNSASGLHHSVQTIKKGTAHAAKTINGLTFANAAKKQLLLKRLGKLHGASRDIVKSAPKK